MQIRYKQTYNLGHDILELYNAVIQIRLTRRKTKSDIQYSKLGIHLPHELPNDLRLRILGNEEIIGKSKIWVRIWPSAQSPFEKLNSGNSSQKTHKSRYQSFLVLFSLTGFLYFVSNILSRIKALDMDKIIVNIKHVSI